MSEVIGSALSPSEGKPVVEGVNEAPPETTAPPKDEFEDKFLRLTRKERALQQAQQELKAKQAEIEKLKSEYDSFLERKAKLRENPYDALEMLGVTYDDLTTALLEHGKPVDKLTEIERKLQELEQRESKAKEAERLAKEKELEEARQKTVGSFKDNLAKFIDSSEYELIKANEAADTVFEVIQAHYEETEKQGKPTLLTFQEACQLVEDHLESQLPKLLGLNKVKAKLQPQEEPKSSFQAAVSQPRASGPSATLTSAMKAASEPTTPQSRRPSEQELFRQAASLIKFQ